MDVPEGFTSWAEYAFVAALRGRANEYDVLAMRANPFDPGTTYLERLRARLREDAQGRGARVYDIRVYVLARDLLRCRICDVSIRPGMQAIDHVLPICMGGDNAPENLRVVHPFCNNSRGPHGKRGGPRILHPDAYVRTQHFIGIKLRHRGIRDALPLYMLEILDAAQSLEDQRAQ